MQIMLILAAKVAVAKPWGGAERVTRTAAAAAAPPPPTTTTTTTTAAATAQATTRTTTIRPGRQMKKQTSEKLTVI